MEPRDLMRLAIDAAAEGIAAGQSPFGCAIARGDQLLAASHNTVLSSLDITAHAEVNALRAACPRVGNIFLTGAMVATTCEPCPMCMAALHWARVDTVYFGATIEDAQAAGFNELSIPAAEIIRHGGSAVRLVPGCETLACRELFQIWRSGHAARSY